MPFSNRRSSRPRPARPPGPRPLVVREPRLPDLAGDPDAPFIVTAFERQERRNRFNVYVDGNFALALDADVLAGSGLRVEQRVEPARLRELAVEDLRKRALDAALRSLAARPRSEAEIRTKLERRGLPHDIIQPTIERLREFGYVDDAEFARFWVESRSGANPRGRIAVRRELRAKGVDDDVAGEAMEALPEEDSARKAGRKKARTLRGLEYQDFRTRLTGYLLRRGFGYDVIKLTVDGLWREANGELPEDVIWEDA